MESNRKDKLVLIPNAGIVSVAFPGYIEEGPPCKIKSGIPQVIR